MARRISGMKARNGQLPAAILALASLLVALIGAAGAVSAGETSAIALVVSKDWKAIDAVSLADLRKIYLGKRKSLAGERLQPWHQRGGTAIRLAFDEAVVDKSSSEIDDYWIQQALLGEARPPKTARTFGSVLSRVLQKVGAIGYVDAERLRAEPQPGIKVLAILVGGKPIQPGEPGYPLHH